MSVTSPLEPRVARLEALLAERLGLSRGPLAHRVVKARRALPRAVRADLELLAELGEVAGHPHLAAHYPPARVDAAFRRAEACLRGIDAADRRRARLISLAASISLNLLILAGGVLWLLAWRGII